MFNSDIFDTMDAVKVFVSKDRKRVYFMIELKNVTKKFGDKTVINNISLHIQKGEFVCFLGASGGGKTTTLKMLNKLISITSGSIVVDGMDIQKTDTTKLRRHMGFVIQNIGLMPHMTIAENITIIQKFEKVSQAERDETAARLIQLVGLDETFLQRYPSELSGGQQQRIGFARALATDPEIILMDEPFSALDPITRSQLQDEIVNIQKTLGKTIIFVTHDIDEALKIADKICIFEQGKIAQFDTPQVILNSPANEYVREFIGADMLWQNPKFIPVYDIMLERPITINQNSTMLNATRRMRQNNVDTLMVVGENKQYIGILEMEKLIQGSFTRENVVADYCDVTFNTVTPESMVDEAISVMVEGKQKILPVVSADGKLRGLVTRAKLFNKIGTQFASDSQESEATV